MPSFSKKNMKGRSIERVDITLVCVKVDLPALILVERINEAMGGLHSA